MKLFSIMYSTLLILIIQGCNNVTLTEDVTQTVNLSTSKEVNEKPTIVVKEIIQGELVENPTSLTPIPTKTVIISNPSIPTPSSSQLTLLFEKLQDKECQPPCYLGIMPGKTKYNEANLILQELGSTIYYEHKSSIQSDTISEYIYPLHVEKSSDLVVHRITLYVYDGIVFRIFVYIVSNFHQLFYQYWSNYSIASIFDGFGVPDAVYIETSSSKKKQEHGNSAIIAYHDRGIFLGNLGIPREDNLVCPGMREGITNVVFMELFDPEFDDPLIHSSQYDDISVYNFQFKDGLLRVIPKYDLQIDSVVGIRPEQFFNELMANPNVCFERLDGSQ